MTAAEARLAHPLRLRPEASGATITGDRTYSDVQLYKDIAGAAARGEDYDRAATRFHRPHGLLTSLFVIVRLPTLAWIEAGLGRYWRTPRSGRARHC